MAIIGLDCFVEGGVTAPAVIERLVPALGALTESADGLSGRGDGAGLGLDCRGVFSFAAGSDGFGGVVAVDFIREDDNRGECVGGRMDCGGCLLEGPLELVRRTGRHPGDKADGRDGSSYDGGLAVVVASGNLIIIYGIRRG